MYANKIVYSKHLVKRYCCLTTKSNLRCRMDKVCFLSWDVQVRINFFIRFRERSIGTFKVFICKCFFCIYGATENITKILQKYGNLESQFTCNVNSWKCWDGLYDLVFKLFNIKIKDFMLNSIPYILYYWWWRRVWEMSQ